MKEHLIAQLELAEAVFHYTGVLFLLIGIYIVHRELLYKDKAKNNARLKQLHMWEFVTTCIAGLFFIVAFGLALTASSLALH